MHCTAMCLSNPFPVSARQKLYSFEIWYCSGRALYISNEQREWIVRLEDLKTALGIPIREYCQTSHSRCPWDNKSRQSHTFCLWCRQAKLLDIYRSIINIRMEKFFIYLRQSFRATIYKRQLRYIAFLVKYSDLGGDFRVFPKMQTRKVSP